MSDTPTYDVLILGAGPAGTSAATILAEKGRRVLLLEKEHFPRYRVGESLIPFCYFPLERLGMIEKMKKSSFTKKYSVQFVGQSGGVSQPFYFFQHLDHDCSTTWQVVRGEFDQMLLDNAVERGAEVQHGVTVKELIWENNTVTGVQATDGHGQSRSYRSRVVIDATGRDALSVARNDWRIFDAYLKKIAIWTYYKGALRDPGKDEGATTVAFLPEKGWFWYLPLPNDIVSVGVVAERDYLLKETRDLELVFLGEIEKNAWIKTHLAVGERCEKFRTTGEYSYRSRYCAADGLVLTGDAFAFLDPVFSSGVFLALQGGVMAGEEVDRALAAGDVRAERFAAYGEKVCQGMGNMRKLVYAFYDVQFHFKDFLMKYPDFRGELTDCLIGDLFKDFDPLFDRVAEFARMPEPLIHGGPRTSAAVK